MMQLETPTATKAIAGLRLIGYALLIFCVFDYVDILYPIQPFNSGWEFSTVGNIIERVGFPLIGFGLVFLGEEYNRSSVEKVLLKPLSWALLGFAIAYWLLAPLGVSAAWRLHNQNNAQMVTQLSRQRDQAKAAQDQLAKLSDEQLKEVVQRSTLGELNNFDPGSFRKQQRDGIETGTQQAEIQAKTALEQQSQNLLKKAVKWTLSAVIAGALFVYLWHLSAWARVKKTRKKPLAAVR